MNMKIKSGAFALALTMVANVTLAQYPPASHLATSWWQWVFETPASENPLTDTTGQFGAVNQSGRVWFLAGNPGGTTVRISGLSASTTYHFRIVGTNTSGTTYGSDRTLPGNSEIPAALGHITQDGGHVDESIAYFEQGLALDPRNMDLLVEAAATYAMLRRFPAALKLYDRALDVIPDDPELLALKAAMYQAEGNLQEAAKLLIDVNEQTTSGLAFETKLDQLRLERNHAEAIRLLQARRAQVPSACDGFEMLHLAFAQRFVGDTAGAKVTAEQARNTLEPLSKEQSDIPDLEVELALADAVLGERDSALRERERAIMTLDPTGKTSDSDRLALEELLALIQTVLGENSRAISTLTQLLETPYGSLIYGPAPVTPALLRLDPIWDPLRADPAFQKLCEEKQPPAAPWLGLSEGG